MSLCIIASEENTGFARNKYVMVKKYSQEKIRTLRLYRIHYQVIMFTVIFWETVIGQVLLCSAVG